MDSLYVKDLKVYAYHGVFKEEKELGQMFLVSCELKYDMALSAEHNELEESVHYGILCQKINEWMLSKKEDLIETVAWKLVNNIFIEYPIVKEVVLELKKPSAPVPFAVDTCSVKLSRKRHRAFIALGSNVGDAVKNLNEALYNIETVGLKILNKSSQIVTPAWGKTDQLDFLNQVIEIETIYSPHELLNKLQSIENKMGRVREEKWGPRNIDLDLIFYDDEIVYSKDLIVPHPYACERKFVIAPIAEIAPFFIDPVSKKTMIHILGEL